MDPNLNINLQKFIGQLGLQEPLRPQTEAPTKKNSEQTRDSLTSSSGEKTEETSYDSSLDIPVLMPPKGAQGGETGGGELDLNASILLQNTTSVDQISARSDAIVSANPRAQFILDTLIHSFINEGKTPEEATKSAQELFISTVDTMFEEKGVFSEPSPDHPKMPEILQTIMANILSVDAYRPEYKAEAFSKAADFVQDASIFFSKAAQVNNPDATMFGQAAAARAVTITASMEETLQMTVEQMERQVQFQPGSSGMSQLEYLKLIATVVAEVRNVMVEIEMAEGDKNKSINLAQSDSIRLKAETMKEKLEKMMKMLKLQDLMKKVQQAIKITVYVIEAVILIFGLVFLPLAPVAVILAFVVGAAIMALTVSLTETKAMDKIFDGISSAIDWLNSLFFEKVCGMEEPPGGQSLWRMIFYQVMVAALIVVAVVLVICLGTMVGPLVSQVATTVINTIMQQSKMMEELSKIIVKACGGGENAQNIVSLVMNLAASIGLSLMMELAGMIGQIIEEIIKMVVQGVIELVKMVVQLVIKVIKMIASAGTQAITEIVKQVIEVLKTILNAVINLVKGIVKLLVKLLSSIAQAAANVLAKLIAIVIQIATKLINLVVRIVKAIVIVIKKMFTIFFNKIKTLIMKLVNFFKSTAIEKIKTLIAVIIKTLNKIVEICKKMISKLMKIYASLMKTLSSVLQATKTLVSVAQSLAQAGMQQKLADFKLEQGLMDSTIMTLTSLIKLFSEWQEAMVGGAGMPEGGVVGDFQDQANSLTEMLKRIIEGMSESVDSVTST